VNLLPMAQAPSRQALENYVTARFASGDGYRFSCHQDLLRITPQAGT
jgi:hypothetical protein